MVSWILYLISSMGMSLSLIVGKSVVYKDSKVIMKVGRKKALNFCLAKGRAKIIYHYSEDEEVHVQIIYISEGIGGNAGEIAINALHCGYMYITVERIDMYDYFKLFHTKKKFEGEIRICVMPKAEEYDEELLSGASGRLSEETEVISSGMSEEVMELRDFRDGDSVRDIHWKRSATLPEDEYVVKQHLKNSDMVVYVVVDIGLYRGETFRDSLDSVYKEALNCGLSYAKRGNATAYAVWDDEKDELALLDFYNEKTCVIALKKLMMMHCNTDAMSKACQALLDGTLIMGNEPVVIVNSEFNQ